MSRKNILTSRFFSRKGKWALVGGLAAAAACIILAISLVLILPKADRDPPTVDELRPAAVGAPSLESHAPEGQPSDESAEITDPRPVTQKDSSQGEQAIPRVKRETSDLLDRRDTPAHVGEMEKNAEPESQPSQLASVKPDTVTPVTSPELSPVLGQVISNTFTMDKLPLPSGSTLLTETVLKTTTSPAVVHLSEGQIIELARNSSAYFERTEAGQIRVAVRSGILSYRTESGDIFTVPAGGELVFSKTQGAAVSTSVIGVVAVLLKEAGKGQTLLKVNDTVKINPQNSILIRDDGEPQEMEVHYIQSLEQSEEEHRVTITAPLEKTFKPQALIVQGDEVEKAILAGATVVGTVLAVTTWGTAKIVGLGAGLGGAGIAAGLVATYGDELKTASSPTPE